MTAGVRFVAQVQSAGNGGHTVVVPPEVARQFPDRPRILTLIRGVEYRTRLAVYRRTTYLGLRRELLRQVGLVAGDPIEITIVAVEAEPAPEPEPVAPAGDPTALVHALDEDPAVRGVWETLPEDHRTEYLRWVGAGPDAGARTARASRILSRLRRSA